MKIRNKIISLFASVAIISCAAATNVFAQTKNFVGASLGVSYASAGGSVKIDDGDAVEVGANDNVFGLDFLYGVQADNKFVVGFGATYDLTNQDMGSGGGYTLKAKDHYSIYVAPTYVLNENSALFLKAGYHKVKGELGGYSENFSGWGYGAGMKFMLDKNLYVQAELQRVNYGSETGGGASIEPTSSAGIISIGHKF